MDTGRSENWDRPVDRRERLRLPALRLIYRPLHERIRDFDEACLGFSPEQARLEAMRCISCPAPEACYLACPLHNDIPAALWEISQGNPLEAAAIYRRTSNFPEVCGRLCPDESLCAGSCGVGKLHPGLRIGRLEAFAADYQRQKEGLPAPNHLPESGRRVAIVGSGPAGLAAAEELARCGHRVTIFELRRHPGGMLVYTVPRFRLPVSIVKAKVEQLEKMGVRFKTGIEVGKDVSVDELFQAGHQAVLLSHGAGFEEAPGLPGIDLEGVYRATELLLRTNVEPAYQERFHPEVSLGRHIAIFGSGHPAIDCARTAVRLGGGEVTVYTREPEMDVPCRLEDRLAAAEEGVAFEHLVELAELMGDRCQHVSRAVCRRTRVRRKDGRRQLIGVEDSEFTIQVDTVILAPERSPDLTLAHLTPGLELDRQGWIVCDENTGETGHHAVFAAGDNTGKQQLAAFAIAQGRKAAARIDEYLS